MDHPLIHPQFVQNTKSIATDGDLEVFMGAGLGPYRRELGRLLRGLSRLLSIRLRLVEGPQKAALRFVLVNNPPSGGNVGGEAVFRGKRWDIYINRRRKPSQIPWLIAHELGHALGLEHPFDGEDGDIVPADPGARLDNPHASWDTDMTTMAYRIGQKPRRCAFRRADLDALILIWGRRQKG